MYRRLMPGADLDVPTPAGPVRLTSGDAIRADLLGDLDAAGRRRLDWAMKATELELEGYDVAGDPAVAYVRRSAGPVGPRARAALAPTEAVERGVVVVAATVALAEQAARTAGLNGVVAIALPTPGMPTVREVVAVAAAEAPGCRWVAWLPEGADVGEGWLRRLSAATFTNVQQIADLPAEVACVLDAQVRFGSFLLAGWPDVDELRRGCPYFDNAGPDAVSVVLAPGPQRRGASPSFAIGSLLSLGAAGVVRSLGPDLLPLAGASYSTQPRAADGASVDDVAFALASGPHQAVECNVEDLFAAAVVAAPAAAVVAALAGGVPETWEAFCRALCAAGGRPRVALDAYAWRPQREIWAAKQPGTTPPPAQDWPRTLATVRARVDRLAPHSLPVQFWTVDLSAFGGVAVILRVVQELQALGFAAQVGHVSRHQHTFEPPFGPVKFRHRDSVGEEWAERARWRDGVLIATHWWSAKTTRQVVERYPGVVEASFWQDREDWFEDPKTGRPVLTRTDFDRYLSIPDGVAVSRWIADSAAEDLRCDTSGIRTIGVGIDLGTFRPRADARRDGGPVRILGMWRPVTLRRGHRRLAAVFAELKRAYGDRVSLEIYGQTEEVPDSIDRHHGWLAHEDVAQLMAEVDVVVEPSDYQGFGMAGLEALACGAALVSTACRGVDEYARHEDNALVVPHDELAAAVAHVVDDAELRQHLQAVGPASVAPFGWPAIAREWARFLLDLWRAKGRAGLYDEALAEVERRVAWQP